ncbi:winged helix-turn-helix transcriptional regulator [Virgibacillus sp. DJP39]|uniref:winged helix-turn-helix transcriptional regulator n=1 Tax=Virgibacillus sp. DJP39 TaxID=3409790 RepID=UPI003BB6458B
MEELCPRFESAMQLVSKRWVGLILFDLLKGKRRFSEMEANLPISGRLLSDRLKMLEQEGIVVRNIYSEFPVRIEYSLSEKGNALEPVIQAIQHWAEDWVTLEDKTNQEVK